MLSHAFCAHALDLYLMKDLFADENQAHKVTQQIDPSTIGYLSIDHFSKPKYLRVAS